MCVETASADHADPGVGSVPGEAPPADRGQRLRAGVRRRPIHGTRDERRRQAELYQVRSVCKYSCVSALEWTMVRYHY